MAVIGCGVFGTMVLSQLGRLPGIHVVGIADLAPERARRALIDAGWPADRLVARGVHVAGRDSATCITDDATELIAAPGLDVLVEATGSPGAAARHALAAFAAGVHVVNVTVEADALLGPLPGRPLRARRVWSTATRSEINRR